jgi:hypothetical protein
MASVQHKGLTDMFMLSDGIEVMVSDSAISSQLSSGGGSGDG